MKDRLLLIEDEPDQVKTVYKILEHQYEIDVVNNIAQSNEYLEKKLPALILLDIHLPDGSGLDLLGDLRQIKKFTTIPIIIMTSNKDISEHALALSLGADDFLIKPIHPLLIRARVDSKLSRFKALLGGEQYIEVGKLKFDLLKREAMTIINNNENKVELTSLQFKLLHFISVHKGDLFTREQLLIESWGSDVESPDRAVDMQISKIHKAIEGCGCTIQTVYGEGYKFIEEQPSEL